METSNDLIKNKEKIKYQASKYDKIYQMKTNNLNTRTNDNYNSS